jgi:uncharacterized membrane protein YebE (DUF533 family)
MPNYRDLIGSFLQNASAPSGGQRMTRALEGLQRPASAGAQSNAAGGSGDLLSGLLNAVQGGLSGAMRDPVKAGGLGALAGAFLGGGSDSLKGALGGGALALLAGVAAKSLLAGGSPATQSSQSTPPAQVPAADDLAELVLRAMISAAKADGHVDQAEMQRIVGRLKDSGADQESQGWVLRELSRPLDLDALVADIPNAEVAAEVYAASLLAIELDSAAERAYLAELARRTGLQPAVTGYIHQTLGVPQP